MQNETYNGWTNKITWLFNIHFDDFFTEYTGEKLEEIRKNPEDYENEKEAIDELKKCVAGYMEEYCKDHIEEQVQTGGFISEVISMSINNINYYEIASCYADDAMKESKYPIWTKE